MRSSKRSASRRTSWKRSNRASPSPARARRATRAAHSPKYADLTERAIHVQKTIIRKLADRESCVIIGRSADYILASRSPSCACSSTRRTRCASKTSWKSHNLSADDARLLIEEKDKRYHKRHLALTGANRGDRHNRDMLIDSSLLEAGRHGGAHRRGRAQGIQQLRRAEHHGKRSNPNLTRCSAHGTSSSSRSAQ